MPMRDLHIQRLEQEEFDILVVGAGINGAVSASALAAQGVKVAIIDRSDFASCTSQNSSNLIWGGIKYMESLEFGLVRKLCRSRNKLMRSYPSSIKEIRFFTTIANGFRWPVWVLYLGAWLYWLIGNCFTRPPRWLSKELLTQEEPTINPDNIVGGFEYSDAYLVDNDARFVFGFVRSAMDRGAVAANYIHCEGSSFSGGKWTTKAIDRIHNKTLEIKSKVLINAAGPFVDRYNQNAAISTEHRHIFSKGVHLIVNPFSKIRRVLTFFADDGRLFFAIPMGPKVCIGTTDTRVESIPPQVEESDRSFILKNINARLKLEQPLTDDDILAERCGVRPLVVEPGNSVDKGDWTSLSRKHVIELDEERQWICIFGGKLTDCLNIGNEVLETVRDLGVVFPHQATKWYGEPSSQIKAEFEQQAQLMQLDAHTSPEASEPLSSRLWRRYGHYAIAMLEAIRQDETMAEVLIEGAEYIRCELHHAAHNEMITKLDDFLRRRSKIAQIAKNETIYAAKGLMEACQILFGAEAEAKLAEYKSKPQN